MSKLPIDIINFNDSFLFEIENAIAIANGIQNEFVFAKVSSDIEKKFKLLNFEEIDTDEFLLKANEIKSSLKGFFPYLTFFTQSPLAGGKWSNLYADFDLKNGISIVTTDNVPDIIIPQDRMTSFFIYYFARGILKFILKDKMNHKNPSPKGCLYDFMQNKKDLIKSMRPNAICDKCRREILKSGSAVSENQLHAIDVLLAKSGDIFNQSPTDTSTKPKIFIGSSTEGLKVARKIKACLRYDAHVDTWADGLFEKPSQAYIEVLESILDNYGFGIFVFTPDDKIYSRGIISKIPRDNVIFEYGMFLGRHSRRKSFFIIPQGVDIKIMTDILGITCLKYDPTNSNLQSAVGDACDQIRDIINEKR